MRDTGRFGEIIHAKTIFPPVSCSTGGSVLIGSTALPAFGETEYQKETKWYINYEQALAQAKKQQRVLLAYFCGSDWDPFTQKLEKDVLSTDMFLQWAAANIVLLKVDFLKEKHLSSLVKSQNDKLPQPVQRRQGSDICLSRQRRLALCAGGYEEVKLHDDERTGSPRAAIKYLGRDGQG